MESNPKDLHHWDVLAVSCIDGRFVSKTIKWISDKIGGVFDFRTEVGLSKAIIDSVPDRERLFDLINTSIRLHSINEVWLIDHIDCGAYGGSKSFENCDKEKEFHADQLNKAGKILKKHFPKLQIKKYFAGWEEVEELS